MARRSALGQVGYRLSQGLRQLWRRPDPAVDATLQALLTTPQWEMIERLTPSDRSHLLNVHRGLVRQGHTDPDLLLAALLHDAGKADELGHVHLFHRTIKVLLGRFAPGRLKKMARHDGGWLGHGIYLTMNHAALGAELARKAGASDRSCWLIRHHDDGTIPGDEQLTALQAIDARE